MGKTLTHKILESHLVKGELKKGSEIEIKIDQTLTQDATGTMAYLEFEALAIDRVKTELSVSYVDHNTIQVGFENMDDHEYLRTVANNKGIVFSRAGNGICHQLHLERFALPGKTLIGSDSHTPTAGGIGSFAMGAGGLDVALAMGGKSYRIISPEVIGIKLTGKLDKFVSAKDVILTVLEHFGTNGNVNKVFEYFGEGVKTLSVPERATICNMGTECGVTTSIFPSDEKTLEFLSFEKREEGFTELKADDDAQYDSLFEIDLSKVVPMAACPHSPGNIKRVKDLEGMKIDQVLIGSCTNSSYLDLKKASLIMKGSVVDKRVSLAVAPGTRNVYEKILSDGTLYDFVKSGARILESACGFCIGNSQSPGSKGVSLRTSNRNFEARSGTKDADVFLVSPETASYSAIMGELRDPRECKAAIEGLKELDIPIFDDSMFIFPSEEKTEIKRGPNIGNPPKGTPFENYLNGNALIKVSDRITTDHICPAGAFLKYRSNIPKYSKYAFHTVDETFSERAELLRDQGKAGFIIAGLSYGQGSSREHAAICPSYLGVRAIIAKSIERIHQANLANFGILPLIFQNPDDYEKIDNGDELEIDALFDLIDKGSGFVKNKTKNILIPVDLMATESQKREIKKGGTLGDMGISDGE